MDLSIVAFDDLMGKHVGRVFGCCGEDCWIDYGRDKGTSGHLVITIDLHDYMVENILVSTSRGKNLLMVANDDNGDRDSQLAAALKAAQRVTEMVEDAIFESSISIVLDPRCKMAVVEFYYERIYGPYESTSYIDRVYTILSKLFDEYDSGGGEWYEKAHASSINAFQKSEMDQYLEEIVFPNTEDSNILHWWKLMKQVLPNNNVNRGTVARPKDDYRVCIQIDGAWQKQGLANATILMDSLLLFKFLRKDIKPNEWLALLLEGWDCQVKTQNYLGIHSICSDLDSEEY
ncbi:hypothetical protein RHSIM_Rhsim06G0043700 [Rhododendron simsii]|uniref:hAT-like transposase RNase-H fold domain-containing protein n=1 Tax=Rhododendron simsii TaxID=118357 RepID=A0A834GU38_RHOSS|nr:hypothetical protein RHSIM_Rhsim06G0043700 [Rhododendron simsii]